MGKEESLQLMVLGKLNSHMKTMKLDHYLIPCTKNQVEMDLNIRFETVKFLEENMNGKLLDISLGNDFVFF